MLYKKFCISDEINSLGQLINTHPVDCNTSWWRQPVKDQPLWIRTHIWEKSDMADRIESISILENEDDVVYISVSPFHYADMEMRRDLNESAEDVYAIEAAKKEAQLIDAIDPVIFNFFVNLIRDQEHCGLAHENSGKGIFRELSVLLGIDKYICKHTPELDCTSGPPHFEFSLSDTKDEEIKESLGEPFVDIGYWAAENIITPYGWVKHHDRYGLLFFFSTDILDYVKTPVMIDAYRDHKIADGFVDSAYYYETSHREEYTGVKVFQYSLNGEYNEYKEKIAKELPEAEFVYCDLFFEEFQAETYWGIFIPAEYINQTSLNKADNLSQRIQNDIS